MGRSYSCPVQSHPLLTGMMSFFLRQGKTVRLVYVRELWLWALKANGKMMWGNGKACCIASDLRRMSCNEQCVTANHCISMGKKLEVLFCCSVWFFLMLMELRLLLGYAVSVLGVSLMTSAHQACLHVTVKHKLVPECSQWKGNCFSFCYFFLSNHFFWF